MMVTYDDGEKILYKEGTSGKNLCAYTTAVAEYSEFFTGRFFGGCSESITLEHLRHVCRTGYEDLGFLVEAIKDYIEDDYTWISERREADDAIYIDKTCYGICSKGFISVLPDKHIGNTGDLKFVELLKQQNVAIS
ncbi:hypothetical protein [Butyrivibrio sp. WCE2006]|uniref:hypothetical protein n=1 Tax=Butyrivibrio sp. WCE2006 TaxID=1410611 RepID=UPI0005D204CA|nr:hypothetical protein [Butyrivibrio sp. WCE2006]